MKKILQKNFKNFETVEENKKRTGYDAIEKPVL